MGYYIGRGSIKTQALANQLLRLLIRFAPAGPPMRVLDDTLMMRWSPSAPGVATRHEHSRKPNRPRFVNAQCWVTIGLVMTPGVLPIRSRLVPRSGNTNKLIIAGALVRVVTAIVLGARVLELWMQVRSTAYALMQLLALHLTAAFPFNEVARWQKRVAVITAGLFADWMRQHFCGVALRCVTPTTRSPGNSYSPSLASTRRFERPRLESTNSRQSMTRGQFQRSVCIV